MKSANLLLSSLGTTIFTTMSALAAEHHAINLGQGFPDTDGPADVVEFAAAALMDGANQYPPLAGLPVLRAAVEGINQRFYGLRADAGFEVVVTSGGTEGLAACLMALLNPGDEVVVFEPVYDTYLPMIRLLGGVAKVVRLEPPDWALPVAELRAAFGPKTKAVLLNNPMNPTGKVFSEAELEVIAGLVLEFDSYAVCDEVYEHLVFDGLKHKPLMSLPGMRERTLRIGSAGKTFSLTGWKIGYVTAPAALAAVVAKAHQNLTFTSPPNLQRAVAFGLSKDVGYFQGLARDLAGKREVLRSGLARAGLPCFPCSGTYFVVADIRGVFRGGDLAFCRFITENAQVAAIPLSAFYDRADAPKHLVRFAFCKRVEVLEEAVERLIGCFSR